MYMDVWVPWQVWVWYIVKISTNLGESAMKKLLARVLLFLIIAAAPSLYADSIEEIRKSAEQGDMASQFRLAQRYEAGKDVDRDINKAADWYRKAARQGHQKAQTNLGNLYRMGKGVDKDYDEAMQWYRKAADQGDSK